MPQRAISTLETKREEAWRVYDAACRKKDALLDEISCRLEQCIDEERLFTLRWSLI
ncbi:MAG: hypothetical protein ACYC2T_09755 [Bacillota bacterium]